MDLLPYKVARLCWSNQHWWQREGNPTSGVLWQQLTERFNPLCWWIPCLQRIWTEVKAVIKKLAVREENTMVARVELKELHNMQHDRDEPIRNFGARLRCQCHNVPKLWQKCRPHWAHYPRCLNPWPGRPRHPIGFTGWKNQNMTLEEVFQ